MRYSSTLYSLYTYSNWNVWNLFQWTNKFSYSSHTQILYGVCCTIELFWRPDGGSSCTLGKVSTQLSSEDRREQLEWLLQTLELLQVLSQLHAHGFVHGDIKPANIMRDEVSSRLKLVDWGASSPAAPEIALKMPFGGTVVYSSPMQLLRALSTFS